MIAHADGWPLDCAFALGFFFNVDPHFWINLQTQYDMRRVQFEKAAAIRARVTPLSPA